MIIHNLKAGWRNILKYKVQNTISVLCLSVGVIFFAATFVTVKDSLILPFTEKYFNDEIKFHITYYGNEIHPTIREIKRLQNQQCVKELSICVEDGASVRFDENNNIQAMVVSKRWLKDRKYESINGKNLDDIPNGTLLLDKTFVESFYGKDYTSIIKEVFAKCYNRPDITIYDTICSPINRTHSFIIVDDFTGDPYKSCKIYSPVISPINNVVLNYGFTKIDFYNCVKRIFPRYDVDIPNGNVPTSMDFLKMLSLALSIMFIGASVLMIGISGYLKMQFQLFALRSREIVLRRCNGAKPKQLFQLLCTELGIIFLFTIASSIIITAGLSSYTSSTTEIFSGNVTISTGTLWPIELTIIILTYAISIGIAWLRVRKVLSTTPSIENNNGQISKSRWNSIMQIAQYSIAASLIYFVLVNYLSCILTIKESHTTQSFDQLKKTMYINECTGWMRDSLRSLPEVDKVALIRETGSYCSKFPDFKRWQPGEDINGEYHSYRMHIIEPSLLSISNIKIQETPDPDPENPQDSLRIPVFAKAEDIGSINQEKAIPHKVSMQEVMLPDSDKYVRLGYIKPINDSPLYMKEFSYYVVSDLDKYYKRNNYSLSSGVSHKCMFTIKNEGAKDEIISKIRTMSGNPLIETGCIYDRDYQFHKSAIKSAINLIKTYNILIVTCLICIILTVYSSIALETRGRQKEVAIRKVNGAKTKDIIKMFSRTYVKTLSISFFLGLIFPIIWHFGIVEMYIVRFTHLQPVLVIYCVSFLIITLVTILTVWQKIYKISHINPALLIKKE